MKNQGSIGVLVLAAGGSSRLGQPKQLVQLEGESLLKRTIKSAFDSGLSNIVVVLGAHADLISRDLEGLPIHVSINKNWEDGMSGSIRLGIETLEKLFPDIEMVMILLSDQPFVTTSLLKSIIASQSKSGKEIVASDYGKNIGVPALFSNKFFRLLKSFRGDKGARLLLKNHLSLVETVPFDQGVIDIDTPEDLRSLKKRFSSDGEEL